MVPMITISMIITCMMKHWSIMGIIKSTILLYYWSIMGIVGNIILLYYKPQIQSRVATGPSEAPGGGSSSTSFAQRQAFGAWGLWYMIHDIWFMIYDICPYDKTIWYLYIIYWYEIWYKIFIYDGYFLIYDTMMKKIHLIFMIWYMAWDTHIYI